MSLWFSATAAAPELAAMWELTPGETAWLTIAVQLGFVVGALLSTLFTLSDVFKPQHLFAGSAFFGAGVTVIIAGFVSSAVPAIILRFLTGMALAGVYPPGMKIMAGWFQERRGFAVSVLIGSLTLGSALPFFLRGFGGVGRPEVVLYGAAAMAVVGGLLALLLESGPHQAPAAPFDPRAIGRIVKERGTMLANGGYFGHMLELYAVWTWIPAYLTASFAANGNVDKTSQFVSFLAFATIAVGSVGAIVAGWAADRVGRTAVTSASMAISGTACLAAGFLFHSSVFVLIPFLLIWGFAIVADSAQFSVCITELTDKRYVGSALTFQTAIGFLLTTVTIQLTPIVADVVGWQWAFAPLAIGPAFGILSMLYLRITPEALQLAGGRK
ncbi:MFS transporter (plasmid) [Natrinema halophilum]|nr:MFS transporter [Natrinema halophilum]